MLPDVEGGIAMWRGESTDQGLALRRYAPHITPMKNWDEIRTALHVAQSGTVSGAADVLGVHHATVIRHIDALETQLGVKLFQRHARGYTATEAGMELLQVAQVTEDQFAQLANRLGGQDNSVSGELVVTSLTLLSPFLAPILTKYQQLHPNLTIRFLTGARVFRLEYGEAHVALRAGPAPDQPDSVVQPFGTIRMGLYASQSYVEECGLPKGPQDFGNHRFVTYDGVSRAPYAQWMDANVPRDRCLFRSTENRVLRDAVVGGAGIGFIAEHLAKTEPNLVAVMPPLDAWHAPMWVVTHMDLHRTAKVQSFLAFLKTHSLSDG